MGKSEYVQYDLLKLMESSNTLIIPNGYFNGNSIATFNISNNGVLKHIEIGNDCFQSIAGSAEILVPVALLFLPWWVSVRKQRGTE